MANPLVANPYANRKFTKEELASVPDMRPAISEAGKGIRAFADETQATGYGVLALGAQKLKDVLGARDGGGLDSVVQTGQEGYTRNMEEATYGRQAPNIARVEDIKDFGGGVDWAAYNLSKGLPQLGALAIPGGLGAGAARAAVSKSVNATAKSAIGGAVTKQMKDAAKAEIKKSVNRGAMAGGFAGGAGFEGGHAMGQALEAGVDPSRAADMAAAVGGINGALEFLPFYSVAKKLGRGDFAKDSIRKIIKESPELSKRAVALAVAKEASKRAGGAAALGAGTEGITEGLQELVNIAGLRWAEEEEMFADLDEEDWSAVKNGMAAGLLIGGVAGGGAGVFKGPEQTAPDAVVPPEAVAPPVDPVPPVPGTDPKLIGQTVITPMHAEKKQPAGPGQELAQVPGLEQLPLQGELVDPETSLAVQGEQAQIEDTPIEAKFKNITGQIRVGEQKKLEAPVEIRDPRTNTTKTLDEDFWMEGIDDDLFLVFNKIEDSQFSIIDKKGDLIAEGTTKEEALAELAVHQEADQDTLENEAAFAGYTPEQTDDAAWLSSIAAQLVTDFESPATPENTDFEDALGLSGMVKLADGYKLQTMPDGKTGIYVSDSQGEVHSTYPSVAEFEAAWFPNFDNPTQAGDAGNGFTMEQLTPTSSINVYDSDGELFEQYANMEEFTTKWNPEKAAEELETGFESVEYGDTPLPNDMSSAKALTEKLQKGKVKLDDEGFTAELLPNGKILARYPDGEVYAHIDNVEELGGIFGLFGPNIIAGQSAVKNMEEFQDPDIAAKMDILTTLVDNGTLPKEEAMNKMAGLANQLTGDPTIEPPTTATKTSEMDKTGEQEGSNKGAWFTDGKGSDFYVKEGKTPDHAVSEHIAQQLYALAGIDTPSTAIIEGDSEGFAGPVILSKHVPDGTVAMKDGFVIDAWLGNWDVAGLHNDNFLGTPEAAIRIDFGGALRYRAQGGKKGSAGTEGFGVSVRELKTLRDPEINPQAAELFKGITNEDIIEQAGKLNKLSNAAIRAIVEANYNGLTINEAKTLADTLLLRKMNIVQHANVLKEQGPNKETAGTAEALQHWVKGVDKNAPLTEKLKYAMQEPHKGIWAEISAKQSRYGILVINPDTGKVLLRKPTDGPGIGNDGYAWTFAKGGAEKGEHPTASAARELLEETGYKTDIVGQLGKPFYSASGTGALFYVGTVKGEQVNFDPKETEELKWATYEEALALVKQGTNKQGVERDIEVLGHLYGMLKPDQLSEFPIKKGGVHAKMYFQSGQFAEDASWTPWKSKEWHELTPLRQLYVKSAAYLKQLNMNSKDGIGYVLTEADIKKEVARMQKAFKIWSGFSLAQVIKTPPLPKSLPDMEDNFPLKTGVPFVVETFHGNPAGELVGDLLDPVKYAGDGAGGSDTNALQDHKGVFYMSTTMAGAKAWAGNNESKIFAFYFALKNPKVVWYNTTWHSSSFKQGIEQAHTEGHDGIVFVNAKDSGSYETNGKYHQLIAFDAQQQVRTRVLENIGYSLSEEAKTYESQGSKDAATNPKAKFDHDFTNMFGEGLLAQATESGLLTVNETSPEGSAAGTFDKQTNKITINLDRVGEGESPMSVLLHEGRHAGMQDVLGKTLPLFHQDLLDLANRGNEDAQSSIVRSTGAVADQLGIEHGLYDIGLPQSELEAEVKAIRGLIVENEQGAGLLQEEDLAYYIQDAANATDLAAPGLYRRLINALKVWWAQSGVGQMFAQAGLRAELTQEMAVELAKAAVKKAIQGQGEGVLASRKEVAKLAAEAIPPKPIITYKPVMSSKAYYESKAFVEEQPELMEEFTAVEPPPALPEPEFDPLKPEIVGGVQMPVNLIDEKTVPPSIKITLTGQQGQRTIVKEVNARKAITLAKRRTDTLAEVIKCLQR
jgi:8-oxo-dGTP pyrophosphatase MutT (NUDIX family)